METNLLKTDVLTKELEDFETSTAIPKLVHSAFQQTEYGRLSSTQTPTGRIELLTKRHAKEVATLHVKGISTGFISSLGISFVTALYEAIAESESGFGIVCTSREDSSKVLGFVTFTTDIGKLYRSVLSKKSWVFALLLTRKMLSFRRLKKVFETLLYPSKTKKIDLPSSELLSIVVSPEVRRHRFGSELIREGFESCRQRGIEQVKVMVAANNKPANCLYWACGFTYVTQIESHGVPSNLYVANTSAISQADYPAMPDLLTPALKELKVA